MTAKATTEETKRIGKIGMEWKTPGCYRLAADAGLLRSNNDC